ncbi:MAG: hypothetical protein ABW072_13230 [Sedimenticola sp.]
MLLFVRKIPMAVTRDDLERFVSTGLGSLMARLSGHRGRINELQVLRFTNLNTRSVQFHGLVDIEPESSASDAIGKLDGARLNGVPVTVRAFMERSPSNDRRKGLPAGTTRLFHDLRKGDRRRGRLDIEPVPVSGYGSGM